VSDTRRRERFPPQRPLGVLVGLEVAATLRADVVDAPAVVGEPRPAATAGTLDVDIRRLEGALLTRAGDDRLDQFQPDRPERVPLVCPFDVLPAQFVEMVVELSRIRDGNRIVKLGKGKRILRRERVVGLPECPESAHPNLVAENLEHLLRSDIRLALFGRRNLHTRE
jgi:hypothetical protein